MCLQDIWGFSELVKPLYIDTFVLGQKGRLFVVCLTVMTALELEPCGKYGAFLSILYLIISNTFLKGILPSPLFHILLVMWTLKTYNIHCDWR